MQIPRMQDRVAAFKESKGLRPKVFDGTGHVGVGDEADFGTTH
jgi:ribosomal protein L5